MAFQGSLEDLPVADILQLLHVSKKSGALQLSGPQGRATIVLKDGHVVGAQHPDPEVNVGNVLLQMGVVTQRQIDHGVAKQKEAGEDRQPLVTTLVELKCIDQETGYGALTRLIETTVSEVSKWHTGDFSLEVTQVPAQDSFRHVPEEVENELDSETQTALSEVVQLFDHHNKEAEQRSSQLPKPPPESATEAHEHGCHAAHPHSAPIPEVSGQLRKHLRQDRHGLALFSNDHPLTNALERECRKRGVEVFVTKRYLDVVQYVAAKKRRDSAPIVVVDLAGAAPGSRWRSRAESLSRRVRESHAEAEIIALCDPRMGSYKQAFELGVTAVLPKPANDFEGMLSALMSCLHGACDRSERLAQQLSQDRRRITLLKERIQEIRAPQGPSDISMAVLKYVADFVERCVLFLVRKHDLLGLGAFGLGYQTFNTKVARLKIPIPENSAVYDVIEEGGLVIGSKEDPVLAGHLYPGIGSPESQEIILLPLRMGERTAALIYGDFGVFDAPDLQTDALEILADHAGMAFELALSRRKAL